MKNLTRLAAALLVPAAAFAIAREQYVVGQAYTFQGRLEHGQVNDPAFYLELPCGGAGSTNARHSFTFRLEPVAQGPDIGAVFGALEPAQKVEVEGVYRGVVSAARGGASHPTLTARRLTRLPVERTGRFESLYELRRQ
jgi:hypothetical protein